MVRYNCRNLVTTDFHDEVIIDTPIMEIPPTISGCPRLIPANTPITTSKTQPIATGHGSIRPILAVFKEAIQKGDRGAFIPY